MSLCFEPHSQMFSLKKLTSAEQMEECMSSFEAGKLVKDESYHGQSTVKEFLSSFDTVLSLSNTSYKPFLF